MKVTSSNKSYILIIVVLVALGATAVWLQLIGGMDRGEIRNVVLISIDTCRADRLSCYGYSRKTTPNIDAVAAESILFENVVSSVPQTLPAHSSMLTGTTPLYHGIHDNLGYQLDRSNITLPEIMREHGFKTGAIISSFVLDSEFGLDQGFDSYNDDFEDVIRTSNTTERRGGEASDFAIRWLGEHKDSEFFFFLHYFDPHFRYEPPEPFRSWYADNLYAGEIAYTDHCIGRVIDELKNLGLYDSALIIITSDHGEMLSEHGEAEHGYFIYQSAIKVPLIFKLPGRATRKRVQNLVGLVDIVPTVCNLVGIQAPAHIRGKDLTAYFSKDSIPEQKRYIYCESFTPTKHNANALIGVVTDGWKYIQTTRPELYDLIRDPEEMDDLIDKEPQRAHLLHEHLKLILSEQASEDNPSGRLELDEEGKKRLESLGYIASTTVDDSLDIDQSKKDPKDLIGFHNIKTYNKMAIALVQEGKLNEAAEAYRKIIEHYKKTQISHSMASIHLNLAMILKRLNKPRQAIKHLKITVELFNDELKKNPNSVIDWERLGSAFVELENFDQGGRAFKRALSLDPGNIQYCINLTRTLESQGRYDEAIEELKKSIQFLSGKGQTKNTIELQKYLKQLEQKRSKATQ